MKKKLHEMMKDIERKLKKEALLCEMVKINQETGQYLKENLDKGNPLIRKEKDETTDG